MRRPYAFEEDVGQGRKDEPRDKWKDGTRIHVVAGLSLLDARRALDDATFDPERAQLMRLPSKEELGALQAKQKPRPLPRPGRAPRSSSSGGFQLGLLLMLLLALALQLIQLKFAVW